VNFLMKIICSRLAFMKTKSHLRFKKLSPMNRSSPCLTGFKRTSVPSLRLQLRGLLSKLLN
jgi:hypothetical protein